MRPSAPAVLVAAAVLAGSASAAAFAPAAPNPDEVLDDFVDWANSNVGPLTWPACSVPEPTDDDLAVVGCYGIAEGRIVAALLSYEDGDLLGITPYSPGDSGPASTTPDGLVTTIPDGEWEINPIIAPGQYLATDVDPDICDWMLITEGGDAIGIVPDGDTTVVTNPDGGIVVVITPDGDVTVVIAPTDQDPMFALIGGDLGYDNGRSVATSLAFLISARVPHPPGTTRMSSGGHVSIV